MRLQAGTKCVEVYVGALSAPPYSFSVLQTAYFTASAQAISAAAVEFKFHLVVCGVMDKTDAMAAPL
jgi:hypothetical protein